MTLVPGARLGPYEILAAIGAGGMGEVYLARDPRLGREVAIKVLLSGAVDSAERRARFEREAKAIAALNHPSIVTIFAVEEAEGVPFFTMEYVDGRTLAQMIPTGGLPLGELLRIAIPLTDAVGAAHQRGILHRDLKPANVMVTTNGRIKVLDFGLAKLREVVEQADGTTLPTAHVTGEGRILGTVAYMSPEQAEGKALDQRSDVFSLGVMLYEMATGQRPFKGDTSVSVISAILKDTPGSITELRPELPRDLGRIVKHALSKDPEHRYQTVKDLRNDLETLKEDLDSGEVKPAAAMTAPASRGGGRWWVWPAAIVVAAAVIAGGMFMLRPAKAPDAPPRSRPFDEIAITGLTSDGSAAQAVAVSPDGRYVAHAFVEAGREGLRVRQAEASATVQVVAPADVEIAGVTFTPDGNRLSYLAYPRGTGIASLYEVPVLGGTPRKLLEDIDCEVSFSPDRTRFAFIRGFPSKSSEVIIANADGAGERRLAERQNPYQFLLANAAWSPDGRIIAAAAFEGSITKAVLLEVDAATGSVRPIGPPRWNGVSAITWLPDGGGLLVAALDSTVSDRSQLWFVQYPTGTAHRITNDLAGYTRLAVTADGRTLLATRAEYRGTLWVGPAGKPEQAVQVPGVPNTLASAPIRWTADGRILYTAATSGNYDVWVARPDGTEVRQLTTSPSPDFFPAAAPDNRYIVFLSNRDSQIRVWRMDADGSRQTPLTAGPYDLFPVVSGDNTAVYYVRGDQRAEPVYRLPIAGGEPTPLLSMATGGEADGMPPNFHPYFLSPDGSLLLGTYWDEKEGRTRLAIVDPGRRRAAKRLDVPVTLGLLGSFAWAPGGRAVTFARFSDGAVNIWRQPLDGGAPSRVTNFKAGDTINAHAWSPDGKMLAMVRVATTRDVVVIRDVRR